MSVGAIAFLPKGDESMLSLIKQADGALYAAKAAGKDTCITFTPEMGTAVIHRLAGENYR